MNPLVEQMLNTKSRNDRELEILEQTFERGCKCQSRTHNSGEVICSGDVAYRLYSCMPAINVCTHMGDAAKVWISEGDENACGDCDRDLDQCWTIRPI